MNNVNLDRLYLAYKILIDAADKAAAGKVSQAEPAAADTTTTKGSSNGNSTRAGVALQVGEN